MFFLASSAILRQSDLFKVSNFTFALSENGWIFNQHQKVVFFLFKKMYLDILDFHMNSCLQMTFPEQVTDLMISSKMLHVFSIITEETEAKVHVSSQR